MSPRAFHSFKRKVTSHFIKNKSTFSVSLGKLVPVRGRRAELISLISIQLSFFFMRLPPFPQVWVYAHRPALHAISKTPQWGTHPPTAPPSGLGLKSNTSTFIKINKAWRCVYSVVSARWRRLHSDSRHVPLLHLEVHFDVPSHCTFPTKMAPLQNSPSSLRQHERLVRACARTQWVFLIMSLCTRIFFSAGTF